MVTLSHQGFTFEQAMVYIQFLYGVLDIHNFNILENFLYHSVADWEALPNLGGGQTFLQCRFLALDGAFLKLGQRKQILFLGFTHFLLFFLILIINPLLLLDGWRITYPGLQNIVINFLQMLELLLFDILESLVKNLNLIYLVCIIFIV